MNDEITVAKINEDVLPFESSASNKHMYKMYTLKEKELIHVYLNRANVIKLLNLQIKINGTTIAAAATAVTAMTTTHKHNTDGLGLNRLFFCQKYFIRTNNV